MDRYLISLVIIISLASGQVKAFQCLNPAEIFSEFPSATAWEPMKIDSASQTIEKIHWPFVYPLSYKIGAILGLERAGYLSGEKVWAGKFGVSVDFMWKQTLFAGLGYDLVRVPKKDTILKGALIHRIFLNSGLIIQLDEGERHHILLNLRPGFSLIRSSEYNSSVLGFSFGLGYEYSLNSDYILAPEFMFHRYKTPKESPYILPRWSFGLRFIFGE